MYVCLYAALQRKNFHQNRNEHIKLAIIFGALGLQLKWSGQLVRPQAESWKKGSESARRGEVGRSSVLT